MASREDTGRLLTPREDEVLALLRLGLTNADIAGRLGLTIDGAKYHVSQIIAKLGVRNRYEAAHWPERPWWLGATAPIADVARRLGSMQMAAPATARAATVLIVIAAAGGMGLIALLLTRSNVDAPPSVAWDRTVAPAPAFLSEPSRLSGDGWTFESRVANLGELETVVMAQSFPAEASLVDLYSGRVVATGTFGRNFDVKLRPGPELVVSHSPAQNDRLLIIDLSAATPTLAADIALPERPGYEESFAPAGQLSKDGRYMFIPLRSWIVNTLQCGESGGDGKLCTKHGIAVIDLEQRRLLRSIAVPEQCYSLPLKESEQNVPLVSCDKQWYAFNDGLSTVREVTFPPYALFVTEDGGPTRALLESGSVVDEGGRSIAMLQPADEGGLSLSGGPSPIGDGRIVDTFYRKHSTDLVRYLSIIDLRRARVERSLRLPDTTEDVLVLDPSRAVVLVENAGGHELRLFDLDTMLWTETVPVPDAPEGPLSLTR